MFGKHKSKRGGFLGSLINNAMVPATLFGLQQTYRRKKGGAKRTRRHQKHGSRRRRKH